jgi:tetratricopeptide (TPR) repeat protein
LLSCWWFVSWAESRAADLTKRARATYVLSLLAFVSALLTKTSTVTLPVLLLAYLWWRRRRLDWREALATAPHFALALGFGLMTVWFQKHQVVLGLAVQEENLPGRLTGAAWAVWFYLGKILLPVNLCAVYPRWQIDSANFIHWLPLLGLLLLGGGLWWFRKTWGRPALELLGCFVALLFPVLGFFDMYFLIFSRVSDHFAYLALIPVMAGFAAGLSRVLPGKFFRAAGLMLVATLAVLTFQRAAIYAGDEKLWSDTVAKNPAAWNALNNLGCIRAEQGQMDAAMDLFLRSVQLNPRNASAQCNLGKALLLRGSFAEAEAHFRAALEAKPDHVDTLKAFGGALAQQGRVKEAVKYLGDAMGLKPDNETRLQLAPLLAATGNPRAAVAQCRAVLVREPQSFRAQNNLAWILATCSDAGVRDGAEAVKLAQLACQLTGNKDAITLGTLGAAYAEAGQFTNAVAAAEQAIALANASGNPGFARANQQLLRLYRAGRAYHEPRPKQ